MKQSIKLICAVFPLMMLLLAMVLNQLYQVKQELIILEGNQLRTAPHVFISKADLEQALIAVETSSRSTWLLEDIPGGPHKVINIVVKDFERLNFPVQVQQSLDNGSKALVGSSVKTVIKGTKTYVSVAGELYEVVGQLGLLENSPLNDYILIRNKDLLGSGSGLSLNGHLPENFSDYDEEGTNTGVERLLSLSRFRGLVDVVSLCLIFLSALVWTYFIVLKRRMIYRVYYLLGLSSGEIYLRELTKLLLAFVTGLCLVLIMPIGDLVKIQLCPQYAFLVLILWTGFSYFFYKGARDGFND